MVSDGEMSVTDLWMNAEQAEKNGVPVNWKAVAQTILSVANTYIANLEAELAVPDKVEE